MCRVAKEPTLDKDADTLGVTLAGSSCYSSCEFAEPLRELGPGHLGGLGWVEQLQLEEEVRAFKDLHTGMVETTNMVFLV